MKLIITILSLLLVCGSANAVINGSDVSSDDYQDFMVYITVGSHGCGGGLMGGYYIVTARHCIMPISGSNSGTLYSSTITVKQGVTKSTASTYTRTFSYLSSADYDSEKELMGQNIYTVVNANYPTGGVTYNKLTYFDDLVILKLSSSIPHTTGALVAPIYDYDTGTTLLPKSTDFTFYGWGYTDSAETTLADTLQYTTSQIFTDYIDGVTQSSTEDSNYGYVYETCTDALYSGCQWYDYDRYDYYQTGSGRLAQGDSGSPIYYNNRIFGVQSAVGVTYQYHSLMSDFTLFMDEFVSYINDIVYPSEPGLHITSGDSSTYTFQIPVQNLTANSVTFTPVLTDETGLFDVDYSECDGTIDSKQGCIINVTFNSGQTAITSVQTASLYMSTDVTIPLEVNFSSTTTDDDTDDSDSAISGSSGGGSTGPFMIVGLLGTLFVRYKQGKTKEN